MNVTSSQLREANACSDQVAIFEAEWPDGCKVNAETIRRAVFLKLSISWWAEWFLPAPARAAFNKACAPARAAFDKAYVTARAAFDKEIATARAAFNKACAPALIKIVANQSAPARSRRGKMMKGK